MTDDELEKLLKLISTPNPALRVHGVVKTPNVEGKLSKNPSFWTSLVNIVRHYARIGGVRVPVASETTAKVKFVGNAQLDVFYDYLTVNGRAVAVSERRSAGLSSRPTRQGPKPRRPRPATAAGRA